MCGHDAECLLHVTPFHPRDCPARKVPLLSSLTREGAQVAEWLAGGHELVAWGSQYKTLPLPAGAGPWEHDGGLSDLRGHS